MATPTTIKNKTFQKELINNGIPENQLDAQSCPNLANEISNDQEGLKVKKRIKYWVKKSLQKSFNPPAAKKNHWNSRVRTFHIYLSILNMHFLPSLTASD